MGKSKWGAFAWVAGAWLLGVPGFGCTSPEPKPGDSSEPADSSEPKDSADSGDTGGDVDTADTSGPTDTADTGECLPEVEGVDSRLSVRDYGYLFWPGNHWTTWGTYDDVQHVQTGYYALALDVGSGNLDHMGLITDEFSADQALLQENSVITDLPAALLRYSVFEGQQERSATGFHGSDGTSTNPSELIDMGRFMQRVEIPEVTYANTSDITGSLQLAAMTRHFVLTHRAASAAGTSSLTVKLEIDGNAVERYSETDWLEGTRAVSVRDSAGEGWTFIIPEVDGVVGTIERAAHGGLSFQGSGVNLSAGEEVSLSVIVIPSNSDSETQRSVWLNPEETVRVEYAQLNRDGSGGETLEAATFDPERGLYRVALGDLSAVGAPVHPDWNDPAQHNWYNRHRIVVHNENSGPVSVPIAFDGGRNAAFYITGGSPLFRDTNGEPIGVPIQISKNWHETPYWYHLYTAMELGPGSHEFEHTFAHSKWGEAYAAQHAQLALIGWGKNQQWDESSLGAFGESITYDPDMTLGRSTVDDVRPFLVNAGTQWGWTGNVGGASFLVYAPTEGYQSFESHQVGRQRTHYAYTGPNLTNVVYAGVSRDGKIQARISTQLGRTDDLVRAYYHLTYTFLEDVNYDRLALFQVAADRYGDNGFTRYAYGNHAEVLFDAEVPEHGSSGYAAESDRGIVLSGDAPWVMLYANEASDGNLPENLANIGFVVRDYEANIGGVVTTTPYINKVRTYNGGWSQMAFELGLPYDAASPFVPAGSVINATVEYLVPPADKNAYYGLSDYLVAMDAGVYNGTDMMRTLAADNQLEVVAAVGTIERVHPVELTASPGETAAQFTLTGGLGYTPITIHGLARPDGWRLEMQVDGAWERVSQEVEGNDYWQAYDNAAQGDFDLVFNVHNRGAQEYRLVR